MTEQREKGLFPLIFLIICIFVLTMNFVSFILVLSGRVASRVKSFARFGKGEIRIWHYYPVRRYQPYFTITKLNGWGLYCGEQGCHSVFVVGKDYMGRKDIADRLYFSDCQRFAELMNAVLYHGENVLLPENLSLIRRKYPSMSSASGERERDILMEDISQNICYGMEIENESDYSMPERVVSYDISDYEYQIREIDKGHRERKDYRCYRERKSRMKEEDTLLPTVTVVLYLGEGHWKGRRRLTQMFRLSARSRKLLGNYLFDYDFPLLEADCVDPEDYKTDLKEFFQAIQCRSNKAKLRELFRTETFRHLGPETEQVIARHLHVERLAHKMEKEGLSMCKAFDDLADELLQEGKTAGLKEGRREEKIRIIRQMIKEGLDEAFIHRMTRCTAEEFSTAKR